MFKGQIHRKTDSHTVINFDSYDILLNDPIKLEERQKSAASLTLHELNLLKEQQAIGMLTLDESGLQVTDTGWFFVRAIAMLFDKYLQTDRNRVRFSKII